MLAVTPIRLEHGNRRARRDADGVISVGIKKVNSSQARSDLMNTAQQDLEGRHIDHSAPDISVPQKLNDLAATVSNNDDVLASLGTVLNKIQLIADATVNAVDAITKVSSPALASFASAANTHLIIRSILTPMQRGRCLAQCTRCVFLGCIATCF